MPGSIIFDVVPGGTFIGNGGRTLHRHHVTFENGHDGIAFTEKRKPWFHVGASVYYEVTTHVDGNDHIRITRNKPPRKQTNNGGSNATTPGVRVGDEVRTARWQWAIQTAGIMQPFTGGKMSVHIANLEQCAIQLEMLLERLEDK